MCQINEGGMVPIAKDVERSRVDYCHELTRNSLLHDQLYTLHLDPNSLVGERVSLSRFADPASAVACRRPDVLSTNRVLFKQMLMSNMDHKIQLVLTCGTLYMAKQSLKGFVISSSDVIVRFS